MGTNHLRFGFESSKLWVRIILALGTNHLNFGYESSGYETSVGTKRPVSLRSAGDNDRRIKTLLLQRCALRKFHVADGQNTRDQITSDGRSKLACVAGGIV